MQYKTFAIFFATTALAAASDDPTLDPILESLASVPTWVADALSSAEPTGWDSSLRSDFAFLSSVLAAENAGTMPAWYSNLPESVQQWEITKEAAIVSYAQTVTQNWPTFTNSYATDTASVTRTLSSSSDASTSSVSTGGAPVVTGGVFMGLTGAAGILGLAIAL
ncbi:hypothetical protein N7517_004809 [Penicillium concentricum]|uniref:Uncharacterized protein n=1 Tax=Penicillium concentricum TaxID=293559 RepID=A0A9W9V8H7_9EURO|nr:uncharacterized protein N7517_004809 [Penicillium concentricum]KAJ5372803.1 hypothetical protein N7517_004809 [Penicillium concentricum]